MTTDLIRELEQIRGELLAVAEYGAPDGYFTDLELSDRVEALSLRAAALGAPVEAEALLTPREALARVGRLLTHFHSQQEWLNAQQAADLLGVGLQTVYDLVNSGRLPAQRFGKGRGTVRIRRADLQLPDASDRSLKHL